MLFLGSNQLLSVGLSYKFHSQPFTKESKNILHINYHDLTITSNGVFS